MDVEKYIGSGILELYVAGVLSPRETQEVDLLARRFPKIREEIGAIRRVMHRVEKATPSGMPSVDWSGISSKEVNFQPGRSLLKTQWIPYAGWVAAVLLAAVTLWMVLRNHQLNRDITENKVEQSTLKAQLLNFRESLNASESTLNSLRNKNVKLVALNGQAGHLDEFAKVYWNPEEDSVYLDALGLSSPPPGFTYQVWSLQLDPLSHNSIGVLDDFSAQEDRMFELYNPNASQGFAITLEPEGGSTIPTLDQLFALGNIVE